ncbi:MAG: HAMP domain-containing protein, partial [Dehalococcoidia bacterium]|nr:HAMP domain-containing protein [Dehalococcoidia bacterium]
LHVIAALDVHGNAVYLRAMDLSTSEPIAVPPALLEHLAPGGALLHHLASGSNVCGLLSLADGPVLLSARPILLSGDRGPSRGTLVMATFVDETVTQEIRDLAYVPLSIMPLAESTVSGPVLPRSPLAEDASVTVTPLGSDRIEARAAVPDVYGRSVVELSFVQSRDIYAEGQHTLSFFLTLLAIGGTLIAVAVLVLADRAVYRRLSRLALEVRSIGDTPNFLGEVTVEGDDEISFLAGTINDTLAALAQSHRQLRESHSELEATAGDLKRAQQELGATANRLRRLTRHLQSLREDERAIVANEIHDQVGQGLTALKMDLSALEKTMSRDDASDSALLQRMNGLLDNLQQSVRRLASGLRPGMIEDLGLAEAFAWHLDEFGRGKAVSTSLKIQGVVGGVEAGRAMSLFRILQEALLVVGEDSTVTSVAVTLTIENRYALLAIEDNGGANLEGDALSRREMGLSLIRERVEVFGGGATIATTPGAGTTVVAQVPL